ncbi:hypothetical protein [Paenarthrobacter sp. PH39-S1]|uniref:hypothetical protein n=1 Tax=Micrococcaceae TaxID=1268 RepID=UPI0024BA977A|nr:hypothetical protein [Paenarthrobacter sp. PH39-S1]MDJ0357530.1 hypothetical protein [Paenarthrobacter sp. PH39-S1]
MSPTIESTAVHAGARVVSSYVMTDGSPRYGILAEGRNAGGFEAADEYPKVPISSAARMGLNHLAAAINHRLAQEWSDREDPLLVDLRNEYPAELKVAEANVRTLLGTAKEWRLRAQRNSDRELTSLTARRRTKGQLLRALMQRIGLIIALFVPSLVVANAGAPVDVLVLVGVGSILVAGALGGRITERLRLPSGPAIRLSWLNELRQDVIDAELLTIVHSKGFRVSPAAVLAARRGWRHIVHVTTTINLLDNGPR